MAAPSGHYLSLIYTCGHDPRNTELRLLHFLHQTQDHGKPYRCLARPLAEIGAK